MLPTRSPASRSLLYPASPGDTDKGHAGLAYFELWTGSGPWTIQGQIFPGYPPPTP